MKTSLSRDGSARWWMLLLLSLGFVQLTLNWFNIAAAFSVIGPRFGLQVPQLALLISLFLAGYGIFHIPTGFLAYRFGLRNTLLAGILLESLGTIATALAPDYAWLLVLRIITGVGASLFVGCGFSMVTSWFRGRELALALGISGGAAFALGAALGLFAWVSLIEAVSWSMALLIGGLIGMLIFAVSLVWLRTPDDEQVELEAKAIRWSAVGRVLGNKDLWLLGLALLGAYGAYFTASQLMSTYAVATFHFSEGQAGLMAAVIVLAGIPGSIIGGYFADRARALKLVILAPPLLLGLGLLVLPFAGVVGTWIIAVFVGFLLIYSFAAWTASPGHYSDQIFPEDVATAEGLMLTLAAVGGFLVPLGFGLIEAASGFTGAWIFLGVVSIIFAVIGFAAREPLKAPAQQEARIAVEEGVK
ncbi:MFS transporter [Ktedonosporobacter rubrisoli]|uniref:MFS transporter n=1 Tax=Ktedonosporobacter rubrisoli TaxID=2509675 RepID=A0A4P6JKN8_KTERU|nr:MFS transporter [Ktedonosporobacter rubrisoli]QBD75623.1 MFS transporter [Ktedonosporobacter rubrisoli]